MLKCMGPTDQGVRKGVLGTQIRLRKDYVFELELHRFETFRRQVTRIHWPTKALKERTI